MDDVTSTLPAGLDARGLKAFGRSLRRDRPRSTLAGWRPDAGRVDPVAHLAASAVDRLPELAPLRVARMASDPFAFLRGAAGIMADDLAAVPRTGIDVQASGDAHLLNFGVFGTTERRLVFDLNDFDETHLGEWEWDLARLAASAVVAARSVGFDEPVATTAAIEAGRAYRDRVRELTALTALDRRSVRIDVDDVLAVVRAAADRRVPVSVLHRQVARFRAHDRFQALSRLTDVVEGRRVIVAAPPLVQPLAHDRFRDQLLELYGAYRASLPGHVADLLDEYRFVDLALKVVGVGSVGRRAVVVLLEGRTDGDPLFLQIKEARPSVLAPHAAAPWSGSQSERVVVGQRRMQAAGDAFLGWGEAGGIDYYVRQLRDMKGSVDLDGLSEGGLVRYVRFCATALANAHGRTLHPAVLAGYLGRGDAHPTALAAFAARYAEQTVEDHARLVEAVVSGEVAACEGR